MFWIFSKEGKGQKSYEIIGAGVHEAFFFPPTRLREISTDVCVRYDEARRGLLGVGSKGREAWLRKHSTGFPWLLLYQTLDSHLVCLGARLDETTFCTDKG